MHTMQNTFHPAHAPILRSTQSWKRPFDLTLGLIILAMLAPVFLIIAALVKFTSAGPVLFVQKRVGKNGVPFAIYKFRSMYMDAEARRAELLATSDREGICFKSKNDPRITPVGRWLRRLSLDELPQIFNVLKGDMSLVGPRPALPSEVAAYPARAMQRLSVLPGITGLWQVSGRAEIGFNEMVELDIKYARNGSLWADLIILLRTFEAVFSGRGAY
jgi:exopolysaccharide biosynthesis polyprenyl glycosylphosphotransferase